jgi:putative inorganic carbon (hco3(-)) transporter
VVAIAAASAAAPHMGEGTKVFPMFALGLAGVVALGVAVTVLEPAWILSAGLALSIFSGNWSYMHVPGPIDRVVIFAGIIAVFVRPLLHSDAPRVSVRRVHWLLALLVVYAVASAAAANTIHQHAAVFELLDRLGIVPFLLFLVAPAAFATERQRMILLGTLSVVGAYLGATAFFEMVGPHSLVFPKFIMNPALGIHDGRARGPSMFACAVAAAMLVPKVRGRGVRAALLAVIGLCLLGLVLTLTRQVWAGAAVGAVLAALASPRLRRYVPVAIVGLAVFVGAAMVAVPGLQAKLSTRATAQKPVWDRLNSDAAALRMFESHPLLGYGWGTFPVVSPRFYHVAANYPLSSVAEVHNVVLSNAAELGIVGVVLWLVVLVVAMTAPFRRRGPPSLEPWRLALIAVAVAWFVQANFAPLSYAFDNYMPWLLAGIAMGPSLSAADGRARRQDMAVRRRRRPAGAQSWAPAR